MGERIYKACWWRRPAWAVILIGAAWSVALTAHADGPPVVDCYGGALSDDPLHCYVLEQAERDGVIVVDAMYLSGATLYVSVTQSISEWDAIAEYLQSKAQEEVRRSGGDPCVLNDDGCDYGVFYGLGKFRIHILPLSTVYADIVMIPDGADGRRSVRAWASFWQLWPSGGWGSGWHRWKRWDRRFRRVGRGRDELSADRLLERAL